MTDFEISGKYYQNWNGLYEKGKEDKDIRIGRIYIKQMKIVNDELGEFEKVFSITYQDKIFNKTKRIDEVSFGELCSQLESERIIKGDLRTIKHIITSVIIDGDGRKRGNKDFIVKETKVFKEGFFIKNGEVIENTKITGLETSREDIKKAINIVNDLISDRGEAIKNDCTLLRFMLWSPFSWCLKKLGKSAGIYALILAGAPKTSKTGSCLNFAWLYSEPLDRLNSVSTTSVFGSVLEESTLPNIIDEAYDLICKDDMQDPMKSCIYEETSRSVKNKQDNSRIDEFKALGLPIFTLNEYKEIKKFISRRYHVCYYTSRMTVSDKKAFEFEMKYSPRYSESPLISLRHLGRAFADKFIPYLEQNSPELYELEELTVKILREITDEVGTSFLPEVYKIQDSSDVLNEDLKITITSELNKLFRKNHRNGWDKYSIDDLVACANKGEISWLHYKKPNTFIIHKKEFEREVSKIAGESMGCEDILFELGIEAPDVLNEQHRTTRANNIRGFVISSDDLANNVFDIALGDK